MQISCWGKYLNLLGFHGKQERRQSRAWEDRVKRAVKNTQIWCILCLLEKKIAPTNRYQKMNSVIYKKPGCEILTVFFLAKKNFVRSLINIIFIPHNSNIPNKACFVLAEGQLWKPRQQPDTRFLTLFCTEIMANFFWNLKRILKIKKILKWE